MTTRPNVDQQSRGRIEDLGLVIDDHTELLSVLDRAGVR